MSLLEFGKFISHSGKELDFKIECDFLTEEDLETIANIVSKRIKFGSVHGIPRGGLRLEKALSKFCKPGGKPLIVDDVFTTGKSMEEARRRLGEDSIGLVIFSRGIPPAWIRTVFQLSPWIVP